MSPRAPLLVHAHTRVPAVRLPPPGRRPVAGLPVLAGRVCRLLYQHRVATTAQLQVLLIPDAGDASYLRRCLRAAVAAGLVDAVRIGSAQRRVWFLTPAGYTSVEASGDVEARPHRMTAALAAGGLLAHRLAVVDTGTAFVTAARTAEGDGCTPWSWAPEVLLQPGRRRGGGGALIADAVLHYERASPAGPVPYVFLIEVDRGTYPSARLAAKLAAYAAWWRTDAGRPVYPDARLLVVLDVDPRTAARRIAALARDCRALPELGRRPYGRLPIGAVGYDAIATAGPWAPVVVDVLDEHQALVDATLTR